MHGIGRISAVVLASSILLRASASPCNATLPGNYTCVNCSPSGTLYAGVWNSTLGANSFTFRSIGANCGWSSMNGCAFKRPTSKSSGGVSYLPLLLPPAEISTRISPASRLFTATGRTVQGASLPTVLLSIGTTRPCGRCRLRSSRPTAFTSARTRT